MSKRRHPLTLRIFLWFWIGIATLFLFFVLFLFFLPDALIRRQIEIQSKAVGWPMECKRVYFRPFGIFEFRGVNVSFQPDSACPPVSFLQIDRLQIQARIWPLLFRKISVASIEIENPRVSWTPDLSQKIRSASSRKPMRKPKARFFAFSLDTLALRNFTLRIEFPSEKAFRKVEWNGLCLRLSRFSFTPQTDVRGVISLFTKESTLRLDSKWGRKEFFPTLALDFFSHKQGKWKMAFEHALLAPSERKKRIMALRFNAHGEKAFGQGTLDSAEFFVGSQRALRASGRFVFQAPLVEFQMHSFPVALGSLISALVEILPDSIFKSIQWDGEIRLCSGSIQRKENQFSLDLHSQWKGVTLQGLALLQVKGFEGEIDILKNPGQGPVRLTGNIVVPSMAFATLPEIKNTKFTWALDLENGFSSHSGKISGTVENFGEGKGQIKATWNAQDFTQTKNLNGQARLDISGIELATLSPRTKSIAGKVHGHAEFQIQGGRKGKCAISFSLPKLVFLSKEKQDSLPPLDFRASLKCIAKENFVKWIVEDSKFWIGKGISGRVNGEIFPQKRVALFRLEQGLLDNPFLVSHLPFSFLESFEGIQAFGKETLEMELHVKPKGMEIDGHFSIENGGLELPSQGIRFQEIQGVMDFRGNEKQLTGNGTLILGNALFPHIRPDPFLKNQCKFAWKWIFPDRFEISQAQIALPSMAMEGRLEGKVEHISTLPIFSAQMAFRFSSFDTIHVTPSFSLLGNLEAKTEIHPMNLEKGYLQFQGQVVVDSLHVNIAPFLEIQNIFGKIPFSFNFDPIPKKWISPSVSLKYPLRTYPVQKSWFTSFSPNLSTLTIEKIKWKDYSLDHIQMDMDFSQNILDIPRFRLELLGGNVAGAVRLGMREKVPLWDIQADFGQINSATLVHGLKPGEETELNASMHFQGQGFNPQTDFDVNGALHITQIGSAFTSTLLEALDPKGADRNIRLTRRLLSMGSKPKRFSFEIRHGYVYPWLELDQPWYSPLPIPEKIQYGRLPLAFFLRAPGLRKP